MKRIVLVLMLICSISLTGCAALSVIDHFTGPADTTDDYNDIPSDYNQITGVRELDQVELPRYNDELFLFSPEELRIWINQANPDLEDIPEYTFDFNSAEQDEDDTIYSSFIDFEIAEESHMAICLQCINEDGETPLIFLFSGSDIPMDAEMTNLFNSYLEEIVKIIQPDMDFSNIVKGLNIDDISYPQERKVYKADGLNYYYFNDKEGYMHRSFVLIAPDIMLLEMIYSGMFQ